jgi:hypothetical protein
MHLMWRGKGRGVDLAREVRAFGWLRERARGGLGAGC